MCHLFSRFHILQESHFVVWKLVLWCFSFQLIGFMNFVWITKIYQFFWSLFLEFFGNFSNLQFCSIIIIMLIYGCIRVSSFNPSKFNFFLNSKKTFGEVIKLVKSIRNSEMHEFLSYTNVSYSKEGHIVLYDINF